MVRSADVAGTEPEMQTAIVGGVEARLRRDVLRLRAAAVSRDHARADGAAVRLHAHQQDLQPVAASGDVVPQQRRRFVHVDDDHVHVAIVVEIAECATPARVRRRHAGARFLDELLEPAVAEVAEDQTGCAEWIGRQASVRPRDTRCRSP